MQLNRKHLNAQFYTNHLLAKTKSLEGKTIAWDYNTGKFTMAYPCTQHSEVGDTLRQFAADVGIPDILRSDLSPEITGKYTEFQDQVKWLHIDLTHSEVERSKQNYAAEGEIRHLKKRFKKNIVSKKFPRSLRGYSLGHQDIISSRIAHGKTGQMGIEEVTGNAP